jgi:GT2 family glycosyltransferase
MMFFTIMITTKNRSNVLQRTLQVIRELSPCPLEVLITADGCTDDTLNVVRSVLPDANLIVNDKGLGSVVSRDRMIRKAKGELVLALDDDSYPEQSDCLRLLRDLFENNPKLGIATFPQHTDEYPETLLQNRCEKPHLVRSFPCSGACFRVSTYLSLPGFEHMFFHMYEEPDYALQCVAAGWDVLFTPIISIRHHWSPNGRNELSNHHFHARNELWSTLMRCPFPQMLMMIGWRIFAQGLFATSRGMSWLIREPLWWWKAIKGIPSALKRRNPVSWAGYKKWLNYQ